MWGKLLSIHCCIFHKNWLNTREITSYFVLLTAGWKIITRLLLGMYTRYMKTKNMYVWGKLLSIRCGIFRKNILKYTRSYILRFASRRVKKYDDNWTKMPKTVTVFFQYVLKINGNEKRRCVKQIFIYLSLWHSEKLVKHKRSFILRLFRRLTWFMAVRVGFEMTLRWATRSRKFCSTGSRWLYVGLALAMRWLRVGYALASRWPL